MALLTDQFRIFSTERFIKSLEGLDPTQSDDEAGSSRDRLYIFTGRSQEWENENSPTIPIDSFQDYSNIFRDMISLKRILSGDIKQVIRRINWRPPEETTGGLGQIYDMYRHDYSNSRITSSGSTKLYNSNFYVMNSDYNVYKCIYNGTSPSNPNGVPSTVEPRGSSNSIVTTPDNYRWKYLYSIPVGDVLKFVSDNYIPIEINTSVAANAVNGKLDTIVVQSSGFGYNNGIYKNIEIKGDGTGARATVTVESGRITSAIITSGGSNYTFAKIIITEIVGIGDGVGGMIDVIIPPINGHGSNPIIELGGFRIMINSKFVYKENIQDFPINSEYRRLGLISNPLKFNTNELVSDSTLSGTYAMIFPTSFTGIFQSGEIIRQTRISNRQQITARGRVVSWNNATKVLKYYQDEIDGIFPSVTGNQNKFQGNNAVIGETNGANSSPDVDFPIIPGSFTRVINNVEYNLGSSFTEGYSNPEIKPNSGQILYVDNRNAVSRTEDQIEDIKIVIEF